MKSRKQVHNNKQEEVNDKIIITFEFRKLKNEEKILVGDFISDDNGTTIRAICHYEYLNLYPENLGHLELTIWRTTKQI